MQHLENDKMICEHEICESIDSFNGSTIICENCKKNIGHVFEGETDIKDSFGNVLPYKKFYPNHYTIKYKKNIVPTGETTIKTDNVIDSIKDIKETVETYIRDNDLKNSYKNKETYFTIWSNNDCWDEFTIRNLCIWINKITTDYKETITRITIETKNNNELSVYTINIKKEVNPTVKHVVVKEATDLFNSGAIDLEEFERLIKQVY